LSKRLGQCETGRGYRSLSCMPLGVGFRHALVHWLPTKYDRSRQASARLQDYTYTNLFSPRTDPDVRSNRTDHWGGTYVPQCTSNL